jgi:hypothetical protein
VVTESRWATVFGVRNETLGLLHDIVNLAAILWSLIRFFYAPLNAVAPKAAAGLPYNTYFMLFHRLSFRHQWMNVFDKLNAPIANYYRKDEMEEWLKESGLSEPRLTHTNNISWTLHGTRR